MRLSIWALVERERDQKDRRTPIVPAQVPEIFQKGPIASESLSICSGGKLVTINLLLYIYLLKEGFVSFKAKNIGMIMSLNKKWQFVCLIAVSVVFLWHNMTLVVVGGASRRFVRNWSPSYWGLRSNHKDKMAVATWRSVITVSHISKTAENPKPWLYHRVV